jgi:hypothetical protein
MASLTRRVLLTSVFVALSGAAVAQPGYPPIPPPRMEPVPPLPHGAYIWRPGYWRWNGRAYLWVPGRYLIRQPGWHEWVQGRWVMRGGGWVWIDPYWR